MKKLQSKKNYTFVMKDKSQVLGKLIYAPDTFEDYLEVEDSVAEEIQNAIDEESKKQYENDDIHEDKEVSNSY